MPRNALSRSLRMAPQTPLARLKHLGVDDFALEQAIKAFITWLLTQLISKLPFLGWPGIGWIVGLLVTPILMEFIVYLKDWFNFSLIDRIVDQNKEAFEQAKDQFRLIHDKDGATDAELKEAQRVFEDKFRNLIDLDIH